MQSGDSSAPKPKQEVPKPKLMSVIGTYMKPEMHTIYRQVANIKGFEHIVVAERVENLDRFPFDPVVVLDRLPPGGKSAVSLEGFGEIKPVPPVGPTHPGKVKQPERNAFVRFWYGRVRKKWPPNRVPLWMTPSHLSKILAYRLKRLTFHLDYRLFEKAEARYEQKLAAHYRKNASGEKKKLGKYQSKYDLVAAAKKYKPDVIHMYFGNKATYYVDQMKEIGIPWLVSFHGADIAKGMDDPAYAERFRDMLDSATLVSARSGKLISQLVEHGCPTEKLRINRTSIPMNEIPHFERTPPENGEWILIQACRLLPKKGIKTAIEAFALVLKEFPNARFVICGTGPLEDELREFITKQNLGSAVEMVGRLEHEELFQRYENSHIFLHPSETPPSGDQEGVPNAVLEAMATGMPFVATYHGGIPEVLEDDEGGHLVREHSPSDVARALRKLMWNQEHYLECSKRAREVVEERFSLEKNVAWLERIYGEVHGTVKEASFKELNQLYNGHQYDEVAFLATARWKETVEMLEIRARALWNTGKHKEALDSWTEYYRQSLVLGMPEPKVPIAVTRHMEALERYRSEWRISGNPLPGRQIMIAGMSYCGSTVLAMALGRLPNAANAGESYWLTQRKVSGHSLINPDAPDEKGILYCERCGPECPVLSWDFRSKLVRNPTRWREKLLDQYGAELLITSDKHAQKIAHVDPLFRFDSIVLFKDPIQTWWSNYRKTIGEIDGFDPLEGLDYFVDKYCKDYAYFLEDYQCEGKTLFLSFNDFAENPNYHLQRICALFSLPYDEGVLNEETFVQHTIGGNAGVNQEYKKEATTLAIKPLSSHKLPQEHVDVFSRDPRVNEVHERLMQRYHSDFDSSSA